MSRPGAVPPQPIDERPPSRWALVPLYVCVALFATGEQALRTLVSPYLTERLGQGAGVIGGLVAIVSLVSLMARLPIGAIYRANRALGMFVVGGLLSAVAFGLVPFAPHPALFAVLMAVDGLGWSIVTTTQLALLVASRPRGMSTVVAMAWYAGSQGAGNSLGGITAGWVADLAGYDTAFLTLAVVPVIATVIMVVATRHARRGQVMAEPLPPRRTARIRDIRAALGDMPVAVWGGVLIMVYISFISGLVNTFQPVLGLAAGLSLTELGALSTCRSLASSTTRLGSGALFTRWGDRAHGRLTLGLASGSATAVFLIPSVIESFALQVPLFLMIGMARGLLRITGSADAFDGASNDERDHGLISALLQSGLDLGKVVGPVTAGVVAELIGLPAAFRVLPVVLLSGYLALTFKARRAAEHESRDLPADAARS